MSTLPSERLLPLRGGAPVAQPADDRVRDRAEGLRILLLAPQPFFQERGTPIAVRAVVETLCASGHRVDLLTYAEGEDVEISGCTLHRIPRVPGTRGIRPGFSGKKLVSDGLLFRRAWRLVRAHRYDVVHAVEEAAFIALLIRSVLGVPYIYDMDSSLAQQLLDRYRWLRPWAAVLSAAEQRAVRGSSGIIAVCRSLEELAQTYAPATPIARIEDVAMLDDEPTHEPERLSEVVGHQGEIVLYVGNLEPYQGIDLLLDGFAHAARHEVGARLVIIGGAPVHITKYTAHAVRLGIAERVHLLGPRPLQQLGAYLRQADVLVSPRISGTNTPMKIFSYLASGRAVLATRLLTHTQVLDEEIALLVDPEPTALGEGLVRLLRDETLRHRLGALAQARVWNEYTRGAFERKLNDFYDALRPRLATRTPVAVGREP